jgi:predicted nucleic acid-binding protein
MAETLIDTAVIVDVLRGKPRALQYLNSKLQAGEAMLHPLVAAEVLAGARNRSELRNFKKFLNGFQGIAAVDTDWDDCLRFYSSLLLAVGLGWEVV